MSRLISGNYCESRQSEIDENLHSRSGQEQDFNVHMFIVANARRKEEYLHKIKFSAFTALLHPVLRVKFLSYDELCRQYEFEAERQMMETII